MSGVSSKGGALVSIERKYGDNQEDSDELQMESIDDSGVVIAINENALRNLPIGDNKPISLKDKYA